MLNLAFSVARRAAPNMNIETRSREVIERPGQAHAGGRSRVGVAPSLLGPLLACAHAIEVIPDPLAAPAPARSLSEPGALAGNGTPRGSEDGGRPVVAAASAAYGAAGQWGGLKPGLVGSPPASPTTPLPPPAGAHIEAVLLGGSIGSATSLRASAPAGEEAAAGASAAVRGIAPPPFQFAEESRLLGGALAALPAPPTVAQRRAMALEQAKRQARASEMERRGKGAGKGEGKGDGGAPPMLLRPGLLYTFLLPWSRGFDCRALEMDLGPIRFNLGKHLDGQPLRLMAKCGDTVVWNLELFHEMLTR